MNNILKKIKLVLIHPHIFFKNIKKEKGIKSVLIYYLVILFTIFAIQTIFLIFHSGSLNLKTDSPFPSLTGQFINVSFFSIIVSFFSFLLLSFVAAGILHIWIKLWKGEGNYSKTYQLYTYARTPNLLLQLVPLSFPFLGIVVWFYSLIIFVIGAQEIYGYSRKKSLLVLAIPAVLIAIFRYLSLIASSFILGSISQGGFK